MPYLENNKNSNTSTLFILNIYRATPETPLYTQSTNDLTHPGRLLRFTPGKDDKPVTLLQDLHMPDGIAISKKHDRIFWTQMGNAGSNDGSIMTSNLDGSDVKCILSGGAIHTPKQIVIDEEAEKLYFCDREGLRVHRCDLDGGHREVLIQTGDWRNPDHQNDQTRWCVGIAISRDLGKLYWTQKGAPKMRQGRIFSAELEVPSGHSAVDRPDIKLIAENLPEPIDLELDEDMGALYWTDRGEFPFGNTLNRKTLRVGEAAPREEERKLGREILAEGFGEAIGLALDKVHGCAWVADLAGRIWRCDTKKPAAKQKVHEEELAVFTGLALCHGQVHGPGS
ncbi:hypothetical protein CBER1_09573 [Cercospora berteroae]|uniref:YWTD domain-containing protein n=1 Tax=Cercospora berteroae TaxID=357750 RepID=A0A2S6BWJ1_9PEZI|nr:hypothetical protein CBER1_09573 [Cercospora berteroae]